MGNSHPFVRRSGDAANFCHGFTIFIFCNDSFDDCYTLQAFLGPYPDLPSGQRLYH